MNEANKITCGCNACPGSSCTCGCQSAVTVEQACACGPQCGCENCACAPSNAG